MVVLMVVITVLAGLYAHYLWKRRKLYEVCKLLPGTDGLPIVGSGLDLLGLKNEGILMKKVFYRNN
jgi:hypothetical protein